ncbi:hypothetical protein J1792_10800 [Streptomyces triculaminicus]|uniref:UDP-N-acetylmuramyl pentapeptide phosphotransferase/UDP-N-acetylglucosamine-1-phosphate transferase n=2 Tax=Streptomyces TaxID=1883 RepID=A0A939FNU8_9ACTN|nr:MULTISPECIES: hypothetical protein [Streptomyces]MBO0653260.1 hypothetical protein [Streptomyces triculaminicus]QSY48148.1 hypothetical protein J3S04_23590 [Streptomyces griseocarneus]
MGIGTAALLARGTYEALRRIRPGGAGVWDRKNRSGRTVDLCGGPAAVAGTVGAVATASALSGRHRVAGAVAVLVAGGCGAYDDHAGAGDPRRGFRAHVSALRQGEVTSGVVKLLGIGAAGIAAGVVLKERPLDRLLAGVVIAGAAHAVNLLDVRPGRAGAAVLALGTGGMLRGRAAGQVAAGPVGAAAALIADDLGERTMLGDAGAHALGAGLGLAVVAGNGRAGLAFHAAVLTLAAVVADAGNPQSG